LKEELPYIRFPIMSLDEVYSAVMPTELLSLQDTLQLCRYLGSEEQKRSSIYLPYHDKKRRPRLGPNSFVFRWDPNKKHSDIKLTEEGTVATLNCTSWRSCFGDTMIEDSGIYEWSITLDKYHTSNTYNVVIGVVPGDYTYWTHTTLCGYNSTSKGWVFITGTGQKGNSSSPITYASGSNPYCKQGDEIGVRVDMDQHSISFIHNGKDLGVAWKNLPAKVRPCLSLVRDQKTTLKFPN